MPSTLELFGWAGPLVADVDDRVTLDHIVARGIPSHVVMGQTFSEGQTIELVKYALIVIGATEFLRQSAERTRASWLIADHFVTDINADLAREDALVARSARVSFLERVNRAFGGDIKCIYTSELSTTPAYREALDRAKAVYASSEEFRRGVNASIPEDRRAASVDPTYALEEIATVAACSAQVKVGPPYERLYDGPLRTFGPALGVPDVVAIYGTPSFPYGTPPGLPVADARSVDAYGVLPYKRDSKGLEAFRVDPMRDGFTAVVELLKGAAPRAVADLEVIVGAAETRRRALGVEPAVASAAALDGLEQLAARYDWAIGGPLRRLPSCETI